MRPRGPYIGNAEGCPSHPSIHSYSNPRDVAIASMRPSLPSPTARQSFPSHDMFVHRSILSPLEQARQWGRTNSMQWHPPMGSGFPGSLINDAMQRRYGDDCKAAETACFYMPTTVFPAVCRSCWPLTRLAAGLSLPRKRGNDDGDGWPPFSGGLSGVLHGSQRQMDVVLGAAMQCDARQGHALHWFFRSRLHLHLHPHPWRRTNTVIWNGQAVLGPFILSTRQSEAWYRDAQTN